VDAHSLRKESHLQVGRRSAPCSPSFLMRKRRSQGTRFAPVAKVSKDWGPRLTDFRFIGIVAPKAAGLRRVNASYPCPAPALRNSSAACSERREL
jgi:hypothetical protein